MLNWQEEQQQKREQSIALYKGVAANLPGWTVFTPIDPHDPECIEGCRLVNGPYKIDLRIDRGKVEVSGYWPQAPNNGPTTSPRDVHETGPEISCSLSRGPEAIARDITRRFLPEYVRIFAKCQERIDAHVAYESRKAANWAKLCLASPVVQTWRGSMQREDPRGDLLLGEVGYGRVQMYGDTTVKFELTGISVDQAIVILKAIERSLKNV